MKMGLGLGLFTSRSRASVAPALSTPYWAYFESDKGFAPAQWSDQSGNARHLLQATGALQLTSAANQQNGFPAIVGTASQYMQTGTSSLGPIMSYVAVVQCTPGASGVADAVVDGKAAYAALLSDTTPETYLYNGGSLQKSPATALSSSVYNIVTAVFNNATSRIDVANGAGTATSGTTSAGSAVNGIGINTLNGIGRGMPCKWLGMYVFGGAISAPDEATLVAYIKAKWAIA